MLHVYVEEATALVLVCQNMGWQVQVQTWWVIVLCSQTKHLTFTAPLSAYTLLAPYSQNTILIPPLGINEY